MPATRGRKQPKMRKTNVRRAGALVVGLALIAAACGDDDDSTTATTASGAAATTAGATTATSAAATTAGGATTTAGGATTTAGGPTTTAAGTPGEAGALEGFKGTTPLVELSQDFKDKLLAVDPKLTDFNYAAETYDAVTIIALAVEQAKDDGIAYASKINGITRGGTKCTDFTSCKAIIDQGGAPDYDGKSGPL